MAVTTVRKRPAVAARRVGYVVAVLFNAAFLYAANVWPGWEALPYLTEDTSQVMPVVNASILASLVANAVYLAHDPRWLRALGDVTTTTVGLAALVRVWQVFPFDFSDGTFDWSLVVHVLLGVAIVGSVIGILVSLTSFVRDVATHHPVTR